uniref:ZAD domain-containing protein n=1 Tax=Anopheles atroparvus TaxID=41427 RepID=A0AAG5DED2_ANOAO
MNKEKCRLCLCTTYNLAGISSSIRDASFEAIIKSVFCFALPTFDTVDGQKNDLPVLVCFQCSNTIRHFHYFSEHVKANQKKLQFKSEEIQGIQTLQTTIPANWSIGELVHHIKREYEEDETGPTAETDQELVSTNADSEEPDPGVDTSTFATESNEEIYDSPLTMSQPQTCVEKDELAGTLQTMDKRVDTVTKQLGLLIRNLAHSQRLTKKRRIERRVSFEFSPIKKEEELDSFDQQLKDKGYRAKVLDWLDINIDSDHSLNRMHQTLDLIFDRTFLTECSWTGRSVGEKQKVCFRKYGNMVKLFQLIGNTDTYQVSPRELKEFLKKKIHHAKERVKMIRSKTSCHKIARKTVQELKKVSQ